MKDNSYKNAVDVICKENFKTTGQAMLEMAKKASPEERDSNMTGKKKIKMFRRGILAASLVLILGTTVSAMGYGPLADYFRKNFSGDNVTAQIIEEGRYHEIGQEITQDAFTVTLNAITGDKEHPKLLFDVVVNDESLTEGKDSICLYAYILDEPTYLFQFENYIMWVAWGDKDSEVSNLYHVCMDGPSYWLNGEHNVVAAIKHISLDLPKVDGAWDLKYVDASIPVYDVNMEYRFVPSETAFKDTNKQEYQGIVLQDNGISYEVYTVSYNSYDTNLRVLYDFIGTPLAGDETNYDKVKEAFNEAWRSYSATFVLRVDGKDYTPMELGYTYCDKDGEFLEANQCNAWVLFPSIDYDNASSIILVAGDQSYPLK